MHLLRVVLDALAQYAPLLLLLLLVLIIKGAVSGLASTLVRASLLNLTISSLRLWVRAYTRFFESDERAFRRAEFDRYLRHRYKLLRRRGNQPPEIAMQLVGPVIRDIPGDVQEAVSAGAVEIWERFLGTEYVTLTCTDVLYRDDLVRDVIAAIESEAALNVVSLSAVLQKEDKTATIWVRTEPARTRTFDLTTVADFERHLAGTTAGRVTEAHRERPAWPQRQLRALNNAVVSPIKWNIFIAQRTWRILQRHWNSGQRTRRLACVLLQRRRLNQRADA